MKSLSKTPQGVGLGRPLGRTAWRALRLSLAVVGLPLILWLVATPSAAARETEHMLLSGSGAGDTIDWELFVTAGRRSGEWSTIPVPSQWEQHGFGAYNYGHDDRKSREQGRYRYSFRVPEAWRDRVVDLVFEGVMTDTEVVLNGEPAGPVHRGGFYRFRYDVTELLKPDEDNLLEVTVSKHSQDRSVNRAERDADYWVFGGIFRPVYLTARPVESIDHVAVQARHDGRFVLVARLRGLREPAGLTARIETLDGEPLGSSIGAAVDSAQAEIELGARFRAIQPWSAEHPHLYRVVVELERSGVVLHRQRERFGFRTVETRSDGLFVNGHRVLLKGVNRHAFWPASGRALSREIDRRDAELIKSLNMNAVRMSHYPPDVSFLEACDELGIYVIDELAGWHDAYGTRVGRQLVREMVERDVNHPSVIFWANGNEGGWNIALDGVFGQYDPQQRTVLHPDEPHGGIDTQHYLSWAELEEQLDPLSTRNRWRALFGELPLVMPTEVLHGLYDGGSGAGLEDYWRRLSTSPRGAGLFLWSFTDEAVERTDRDGALDTDGNHAPDGVLGPYRELTGSSIAVREIFSPVQILEDRFTGAVTVANAFAETDLAACRFEWALLDLPGVGEPGEAMSSAEGWLQGPVVPPDGRGELKLPPEVDWKQADAVRWTAREPAGRELWTWVLPTKDLRAELPALAPGDGAVDASVDGDRLTLRASSAGAEFDLSTGQLLSLFHSQSPSSLGRGPMPADGSAAPEMTVRHQSQGQTHIVEAQDQNGQFAVRWTFFPSGWLRLDFESASDGAEEVFGIRFDYPEEKLTRLRWLGGGPARVWANRLKGARLGVWEKVPPSTPPTASHEPKLAGYYADVTWAELTSADGELLIAIESPGLYLGLFSPAFPDDAQDAVASVPAGGVSFLHGISAVGTKFHPARDLGPQSRRSLAPGSYRGAVWLHARPHREQLSITTSN